MSIVVCFEDRLSMLFDKISDKQSSHETDSLKSKIIKVQRTASHGLAAIGKV